MFKKLKDRLSSIPKRYIVITSVAVKLAEVAIAALIIRKFFGSE